MVWEYSIHRFPEFNNMHFSRIHMDFLGMFHRMEIRNDFVQLL